MSITPRRLSQTIDLADEVRVPPMRASRAAQGPGTMGEPWVLSTSKSMGWIRKMRPRKARRSERGACRSAGVVGCVLL